MFLVTGMHLDLACTLIHFDLLDLALPVTAAGVIAKVTEETVVAIFACKLNEFTSSATVVARIVIIAHFKLQVLKAYLIVAANSNSLATARTIGGCYIPFTLAINPTSPEPLGLFFVTITFSCQAAGTPLTYCYSSIEATFVTKGTCYLGFVVVLDFADLGTYLDVFDSYDNILYYYIQI